MIAMETCCFGPGLQDIRNQNVHDLDLDFWNGPRSNVYTPIERPDMTSYLMTIIMIILFDE